MLSKFIILALTEESLAVILHRNILKQGSGKCENKSCWSNHQRCNSKTGICEDYDSGFSSSGEEETEIRKEKVHAIVVRKGNTAKITKLFDGTLAGKKVVQLAWSCKRNECRSAGFMITATVITECFDDFKNKFKLSSFGAEEGEGIEYGLGATPTLVQAFQKK